MKTMHSPLCVSYLTPWNALILRPRVPRTHAGCFLPPGPRPGHRCVGGRPSVSRGTLPGLGAHPLPDPRLVHATERGRIHVSLGASRSQVGVIFQAEYQPQGEKGGRAEGLMGQSLGQPSTGTGSSDLTCVPEMHRVGSGPPLHLLG